MNKNLTRQRRILLANGPRLLREIFKRAFQRYPGVEIVGEYRNSGNLAAQIGQLEAHWIIVSLKTNGEFPEFVDHVIKNYPGIGVLAISMDGSKFKARCGELYEEDLTSMTLNDLMDMIRSH